MASLVQEVTASGTTTQSANITPTAGNSLIAIICTAGGPTDTSNTCSDGVNSWGRVGVGGNSGSTNTRIELWYAYNVAGTAVTITNASSTANRRMLVQEWSDFTSATNEHFSGIGNASSTNVTTDAPTFAVPTQVIAAINFNTSSGVRTASHDNIGGGWTAMTTIPATSASVGFAGAYQPNLSAVTLWDEWTLSTAAASGAIIASFHIAASGTSASAQVATGTGLAHNAAVSTSVAGAGVNVMLLGGL